MSEEQEEQNEIMAAAQDAKAHKERAKKSGDKDKKDSGWSLGAIGLGVGVGSAAVAAALLYAGRNRGKRDD